MSYKLSVAAKIDALGEQSSDGETVLDYTYISEENFLLIILLTSKGHLLTYYKTGKNCRSEITSLAEIYSEWVEPVVIALTKDASVVVLILSNGEILLLPIRCLMDFSIESAAGREEKMCFRFPTSAFCFTSASTNHSYLVYSNKAGVISVVDLHLRRLSTQLAANESIHGVELYEENGSKYILVTQYTGFQVLIPLETLDLSVRETLAHIIPSQISSDYQLHSGLKFFNRNAGFVCAINQKTSNVEIYDSIAQLKLPQQMYKVPCSTWLVYYSPKIIVAIAESNRIFVNLHFLMSDPDQTKFLRVETDSLDPINILGIVPVIDGSEGLEECLLVTITGLVWLRPQRNTVSLVAEFLGGYYFAVDVFNDISKNLRLDPKEFCLTILRSVLKSENRSTYDLDGLISLAFELNLEMEKLMEALNEYHQADLLLPFLSLKCEKEPADATLRQFLFNAYMTKLWRINQQEDNWKEKEALEYEIKHFLIKFDSTPDVLSVLLKQFLWSCVAVLLCRDAVRHSLPVARYLLELPSWRTTSNLDGLVKCLSFIHWPSLDASLGQTLVNKTINILPNLCSVTQLRMIMDMAEMLVKKSFEFALPLYIIVSIRMLNIVSESKESQNVDLQPKLSSGSNCSAAVVDEGQALFWGDFSAGNLRLKNEETRKRKKGSLASPHPNSSPLKQQKRSQINKSSAASCVLIPKAVVLPKPSGNTREYEAKSVQCGTEHALLLTTEGLLFSWGRNRFGQCGVGNDKEVDRPTLLQGDWGE
uniref:Uncharacterized protein n=1 Tax=Ditylenchus dipsaci TaxID=166011 RepID=A0A915D9X9_9BILA